MMSNVIGIDTAKHAKGNSHRRDHGEGSIRRVSGSPYLYLDFYYYSVRVRKSSGYPDSPEGWKMAEQAMDQMMDEIQRGVFNFEKRFPHASQREKQLFSQLEGRYSRPSAREIIIDEYYERWKDQVWDSLTLNQRNDYEGNMKCHILPYFGGLTFDEITTVRMKAFLGRLRESREEPLSRNRVRNILTPFRGVFSDACSEYHWTLPDPFHDIGKVINKLFSKRRKGKPPIFTLGEWLDLLEQIPYVYRPATEFLVLTGVRSSELAGLEESSFSKETIKIVKGLVGGRETDLKTEGSDREIPTNARIRIVIEQQRELRQSLGLDAKYFFTDPDGNPLDHDRFRNMVWIPSFGETVLAYRKPSTTRHTFAEWMLLIDTHPEKLVKLMGHSSKKMVYEVYGQYRWELEAEKPRIKAYMGG